MRGIVYDLNMDGHHELFLRSFRAAGYGEFWESLKLTAGTVADLGFDRRADDRAIWNRCQSEGFVLVTTNRNDDGPDSLGRTLSDSNREQNLPVITLANNDRFVRDREYAILIGVQFLEMLDDIQSGRFLGSGRLYLPSKPFV